MFRFIFGLLWVVVIFVILVWLMLSIVLLYYDLFLIIINRTSVIVIKLLVSILFWIVYFKNIWIYLFWFFLSVPVYEKIHPDSLHHLVWLGIETSKYDNRSNFKLSPEFHIYGFSSLKLSVHNLGNVSVETLNKLDIDAFLYATGKLYIIYDVSIDLFFCLWQNIDIVNFMLKDSCLYLEMSKIQFNYKGCFLQCCLMKCTWPYTIYI